MTAFKIKNELPFLGENLRAFKNGFFDEEETDDSEEETEDDEINSEAEEREEVADEPEEVVVTVHSGTQTAEKYFAEKKKPGFFDLGSPLAESCNSRLADFLPEVTFAIFIANLLSKFCIFTLLTVPRQDAANMLQCHFSCASFSIFSLAKFCHFFWS